MHKTYQPRATEWLTKTKMKKMKMREERGTRCEGESEGDAENDERSGCEVREI